MQRLLLNSVLGLTVVFIGRVQAQPFVEHVTPPVVERGRTTRVTFVGRDCAKAFDVWNSLPAGALKAKVVESDADRAVFELSASSDAPVGLCGVRVATPDGLSNLHLFHVEDLPVGQGVSGESSTALLLPAAVWGTMREGTIDRYTLQAKAGETLSFEVVANRLGKDADPLVILRDAAGRFVAERDNDPGLYFDCRFEHTFAKAGLYTLDVRDARFKGNEHRQYVLRVGRFPAGRVAVPSAVNPGANKVALGGSSEAKIMLELPPSMLPGPFSASLKRPGDDGSTGVPLTTAEGPITVASENDEPVPASCPGVLCGVLRKPGVRQRFHVKLEKGQRLFVRGEARAINSPAELELALLDKTGKELRRGSEAKGSDEVTLEYTAAVAGEFQLAVRDGLRDGGDAFAYRLTLRNDPFPPQIAAEAEGLVVPRGSYQILPLVVTRSPGATGAIRLTLHGAPPGVTLTPNMVEANDTTVVCKLEASSAAPLGIHTLQILADADGPSGPTRSLVRTQPLVDRKLVNIDLIPLALREDQRRLPPSVTDRFALQVTPPAPFTFELPNGEITLVRYQRVAVPIVTTREAGFMGPITFSAEGGQLAPKEEGRTRVYAEFPTATAQQPRVDGLIQSLILSNLAKTRIKVSALGTHDGRSVTLTRSFDLDLVAGFTVKGEPAKVSVLPGEIARARLVVHRVGSLESAVTVRFSTNSGLELPESVVIEKGQTGVDFAVPIPGDMNPRKINIQALASGDVNGYEEEIRGLLLEIEVRKPDAPKKADVPKKK